MAYRMKGAYMKGVKSGGSRKIGRNKDKCAKYTQAHKRERNKICKYRKVLTKLQDNSDTAIDLKKKIRELEKVII